MPPATLHFPALHNWNSRHQPGRNIHILPGLAMLGGLREPCLESTFQFRIITVLTQCDIPPRRRFLGTSIVTHGPCCSDQTGVPQAQGRTNASGTKRRTMTGHAYRMREAAHFS
ncbi:hypothetical protein GLS_c05350 [Gluconobacter oxydans DSM 3504]|uniref:Uncharacterized protein n=1 Tax=Gluconobacter oxydans DSM 3504 TaxID=1288313 RepID=A0A067Z4D5_GLUOY|nr:hypothetical protein GLS_c05350 [Gluconobacter oxydans DSM 3504]